MQVTSVTVRKIEKEGSRMRGIASILLDDSFAVHDIRIIEGDNGLFIAMPSRKTATGGYRDIAHPINPDARKQLDVTFFGAYIMTKQVLKVMREQNNGRIINVSSIGGVIPLPFQAFYSSSKCAMDMLFDALRAEVYPYHIQITSVKPGDSKTGFTSNRYHPNLNDSSPYKKAVQKCLENITKDEQTGFPPIKVAKKIYKISQKKKAPYSVSVGTKDKFLAFIYKILPKRLRNYLLYKIYAKE